MNNEQPAPRRGIGRRKRKLRRATWIVLALALLSAATAYFVYRATRPEVRRPGEALADITRKLSEDLPADAPFPAFSDHTEAAGLGAFRSFIGERSSQLPEDMGPGVAWGDFDNDGDDDLFLVAAGGPLTAPAESWAESMLFENLGDGTFERSTAFPETRITGMGAAWGDADGDGWLDLAVSGYNSLMLFRNTAAGRRRFVRDDSFPDLPGYWAGVSWADFDNDGDLDLYVCGYVKYEKDGAASDRSSVQSGTSVPYTLNPASYEPERNLLFRNDGSGAFTEEALLFGVSNPTGRSLAALWHDYNADGRLDVYIANDISDNALLLNRGETFEDTSLAAWVADYRGAMGLTVGDWNRDGDDDLFVTHWVAQENALYDSRLAENTAAGNDQLTFADLAAPLGLGQIALHSVGWATEFADFDADGWLDLVVANGSTIETGSPKRLKKQPAMLLWNRRGEYFHDLAPAHDLLATPRLGRGLALSDFDRDGDLDILMMELDSGARLFKNEMQGGNWLELRLRDPSRPGSRGEGATAIVRSHDIQLRRPVGGTSYLSQSSSTVHIGLGQLDRIDEVEVRWLGGESEFFTGVELNAIWELRRGQAEARRVSTPAAGSAGAARDAASSPSNDKQQQLDFWKTQRAAMDAMKIAGDLELAADLFERALALNPDHTDSRYYLANLVWTLGDPDRGLAELDNLRRSNPSSHRAHKQWGVLRAMTASGPGDLDAAAAALERALEINPEETGSLLALGEIAILQGRADEASQRLEWACRTNPRAVGGFYLRAYLDYRYGDGAQSAELLRAAKAARGPEWKPRGAAAEGDVRQRMHVETSPLAEFWQSWNGSLDPETAFAALDSFLRR